jgi:hypothetical protein
MGRKAGYVSKNPGGFYGGDPIRVDIEFGGIGDNVASLSPRIASLLFSNVRHRKWKHECLRLHSHKTAVVSIAHDVCVCVL